MPPLPPILGESVFLDISKLLTMRAISYILTKKLPKKILQELLILFSQNIFLIIINTILNHATNFVISSVTLE